MNAKHTPGPWASYPCNLEKYSRVITAKGCMVQVAHTGVRGEVAMTKDVWGDRMTYGPFEETTANARLIVAAPELLEAAIELKDVCNRPSAARTRAEAWRKLDKAIAKALQPNAEVRGA